MSVTNSDEVENGGTICDCCGEVVPSAESQSGPAGTEWEDCQLCNDCYAEEDC